MAASGTQRSILVVDGDQKVIDMLRRNLEHGTLDIQEATTGLECLHQVSTGKTALVIMDTDLADFSVWGIISLLRMTEATAAIPVILMGPEPPDRVRRDFQPDEYIQKPFDMRDLLARVERYAGRTLVQAVGTVPGPAGTAR
jgi:DNA-binding response OmpR family regulator